jgi:hypothetical protein
MFGEFQYGSELQRFWQARSRDKTGVAPNFQSAGFVRPDAVELVINGKITDTLMSPRSAQEYGVATNGAQSGGYPESLAISPGSIPTDGVAEALGTGLFVGNLRRTNSSDMSACRTAGMTRLATFWMDGGEIVAPVNVLRFDDTAFNMLGAQLEGLTDEAEVLLDPSTYMERSGASARLPGAPIFRHALRAVNSYRWATAARRYLGTLRGGIRRLSSRVPCAGPRPVLCNRRRATRSGSGT